MANPYRVLLFNLPEGESIDLLNLSSQVGRPLTEIDIFRRPQVGSTSLSLRDYLIELKPRLIVLARMYGEDVYHAAIRLADNRCIIMRQDQLDGETSLEELAQAQQHERHLAVVGH